MKKPASPMEPGGDMAGVAMILTLAVAPVTAGAAFVGGILGTAIGGFMGATGSAGFLGGVAAGALYGAGLPLALGFTASALIIAAPFARYGLLSAAWQISKKLGRATEEFEPVRQPLLPAPVRNAEILVLTPEARTTPGNLPDMGHDFKLLQFPQQPRALKSAPPTPGKPPRTPNPK